ncbi:hypothetical protein L9F63_021967, partial [Diploptera punctata]
AFQNIRSIFSRSFFATISSMMVDAAGPNVVLSCPQQHHIRTSSINHYTIYCSEEGPAEDGTDQHHIRTSSINHHTRY